jgi:hypothetical protein
VGFGIWSSFPVEGRESGALQAIGPIIQAFSSKSSGLHQASARDFWHALPADEMRRLS